MDITTQERVVIRTTTNYVVSWSLIIMSWSLSWSFPIGLYYLIFPALFRWWPARGNFLLGQSWRRWSQQPPGKRDIVLGWILVRFPNPHASGHSRQLGSLTRWIPALSFSDDHHYSPPIFKPQRWQPGKRNFVLGRIPALLRRLSRSGGELQAHSGQVCNTSRCHQLNNL